MARAQLQSSGSALRCKGNSLRRFGSTAKGFLGHPSRRTPGRLGEAVRVGRRDGLRRALLRHRLEVLPHLRRERQCACTLPPPPAPSRQAPARFAFNLQGVLPQPPSDATPAPYNDAKVANRNGGGFGWEMTHVAVSRRFPRQDCSPCRGLHVRRDRLGFVHR